MWEAPDNMCPFEPPVKRPASTASHVSVPSWTFQSSWGPTCLQPQLPVMMWKWKTISNELMNLAKMSVELLDAFRPRSHHVGQKKHPGESRPGGIVREQYILEAAVQSLSLSLIPHGPHPSSPISFLLSTTTITSLPFKRQTGKIPPLVSFKISFPVLKTSCLLSQVLSRQELTEAFFQIKSVLSWRKIVASEIFSTNEPCISYAHHFSDIQGWNNFSSFSFSILSRLFPPLILPLFLTPGSPFLHPFVQLEEIKLSMMRCPVIFFRSIAVLIPKNKLPHCRTVHTESMNKH